MVIFNNLENRYGFRLLSLELVGNTLMGKSPLLYSFIEPDDKQTEIYTTVIIGSNGTGKSNLFRIIIELLKELYDLSLNKERSHNIDGKFRLKFSIEENIYEYGNFRKRSVESKLDDGFEIALRHNEKRSVFLLKNELQISFDEVKLPEAIVANSFMLTDKYPFFKMDTNEKGEKIEVFPNYKYLGIRNIAQNASTRAYVRKTVEFIVEQKDSEIFRKGLTKATNFLGLSEAIEIYYTTSNTFKFFKGDLTPEKLQNYFLDIEARYLKKETDPPYKLRQYLKIEEDKELVFEICNYCNGLVNNNRLKDMSPSTVKKLSYNIIDTSSFEQLKNDFRMIELLRQLGMLYPPEIQLHGNSEYSLQESSSGEYHFFSSMVGLLATVKENSLVFIDEPEISLHPNWQMKYFSFLRELFSDAIYATCHILVATHSHFLISDLKGNSSKIIGLKKEDGRIQIVDLPVNIDTYGWSAEEVLYSIFSVRTTRNFFLEYDLTKLVTLVNRNSVEYIEIRRIVEKISSLVLSENDPLNIIIEKAENYLVRNNA